MFWCWQFGIWPSCIYQRLCIDKKKIQNISNSVLIMVQKPMQKLFSYHWIVLSLIGNIGTDQWCWQEEKKKDNGNSKPISTKPTEIALCPRPSRTIHMIWKIYAIISWLSDFISLPIKSIHKTNFRIGQRKTRKINQYSHSFSSWRWRKGEKKKEESQSEKEREREDQNRFYYLICSVQKFYDHQ